MTKTGKHRQHFPKAMYRAADGWVLGLCEPCGRANYVEPHGVSAWCPHCNAHTTHLSVPTERRDPGGISMVR